MKIDINYSEENDNHAGVYECKITGIIFLFTDESDSGSALVLSVPKVYNGIYYKGNIRMNLSSCTNKEYWTKLNADSVTFNLKD